MLTTIRILKSLKLISSDSDLATLSGTGINILTKNKNRQKEVTDCDDSIHDGETSSGKATTCTIAPPPDPTLNEEIRRLLGDLKALLAWQNKLLLLLDLLGKGIELDILPATLELCLRIIKKNLIHCLKSFQAICQISGIATQMKLSEIQEMIYQAQGNHNEIEMALKNPTVLKTLFKIQPSYKPNDSLIYVGHQALLTQPRNSSPPLQPARVPRVL